MNFSFTETKPSYIDKWKQKNNDCETVSPELQNRYDLNDTKELENRVSPEEHSIIVIPETAKQCESISNRIRRRLRKVISMGGGGENTKCSGDVESRKVGASKDDTCSIVENIEFEFGKETKPAVVSTIRRRKLVKSLSLSVIDCVISRSNDDFSTTKSLSLNALSIRQFCTEK